MSGSVEDTAAMVSALAQVADNATFVDAVTAAIDPALLHEAAPVVSSIAFAADGGGVRLTLGYVGGASFGVVMAPADAASLRAELDAAITGAQS